MRERISIDLDLTVVGSINADIIATTQRLPAAGETVGGGRLVRSPGGKGANQSVAAARLGARTAMVGAIGSDASGAAMREALDNAGVGTEDVALVDAETGTALIMVDADGENQISVCEGANAHVSITGPEFPAHETVLTQLEISLDLITELSHSVRGRFVINAAPALPLPAEVVERADLIIVNETEYDLLPQLQEAKLVAVTFGSQGSALYEHGRLVAFAQALPRRPVNTVGAEAVMDPSAQPESHPLEHYLASVASAEAETTSPEYMT